MRILVRKKLEARMFYSHKSQVIDHHLTYLHTQKVFTGQYWDEFALTCSIIPEQAQVLMLGLSMGGGIRPLLSSTKKIKLTCVDYDNDSVQKCRELYKDYFPGVKFESITAEAKEFLKKDSDKYDAIWFDIYESESYSPLAFDAEFMKLIRSRLTDNGILLLNSYGLPNHFMPLKANGVQHKLASFLKSQFGFVAAIPFRRNITFVVSAVSIKESLAKAHESLNPIDRFTFDFIQNKIRHRLLFDELNSLKGLELHETQFTSIDTHMRQCWSNLRELLNLFDLNVKENSEFISLIQNQERCERVIRHLIQNKDLSVCFIPILASGESHMQELQLDWLFEWTEQNKSYLSQTLKSYFNLIWLTQLWTLIIHPHGRYKKYYFRFLSLMQNNEL